MPKNVIIVGMPRSGTSMTAALFEQQGYFLSPDQEKELRPADAFNPLGYFESNPLVEANALILKRTGFPHDNTWLYDPFPPEQARQIRELKPLDADKGLIHEFQAHQPWLWKDPRLCFTLGYWAKIIDWEHTAVLLIRRNPSDIYNSFLRLGWRTPSPLSRRDVFQRTRAHIDFAEQTIQELAIPCLSIHYDDFHHSPDRLCAQLNEHFDLSLTPGDLPYSREYDHSGARGRISTLVEVVANALPSGMTAAFKKTIPRPLLRWLYPERNY